MSKSVGQVRAGPGIRAWLAIWIAAALLTIPPGVAAADTVARDARIGGDNMRTRFVADLSKKVRFHAFTLTDPYRVVVDLPNVKFKLPAGLGRKGRGLVTAFRYGLFAPGKSRIVIDVSAPVVIEKAFVLTPRNKQPARLVIDIIRTDKATFLANLRKASRRSRSENRKVPGKTKGKSVVKLRSAKDPRRRGSKPVVVIDPGHGGIDPGAVTKSGVMEKDIVFAFAETLRQKIAATGRYRPILTRNIDIFLPLRDRVEFARRKDAALFISLHADTLPGRSGKGVSGATVYTLSEQASDEEAKALAAKENRADIIAGVELPDESNEVTSILIDLAQRETKNHSITLANTLLRYLNKVTTLNKKRHRFAGFVVLKAPDVPSVLVELGYLTNLEDQERLQSEEWRDSVAAATAKAVDKFISKQLAGNQQ